MAFVILEGKLRAATDGAVNSLHCFEEVQGLLPHPTFISGDFDSAKIENIDHYKARVCQIK